MTTWGQARIEVIASKEHIVHELQRGVPMKQIHDALVQSGRVSVTYNSFRRQIKFIRDELKESLVATAPHLIKSRPTEAVRKATPHPSTTPMADSKPKGGFEFNPLPNADDYF